MVASVAAPAFRHQAARQVQNDDDDQQTDKDHAQRGDKRCIFGSETKKAGRVVRSEEHTSELQSLMRNSYAVICLKKKTKTLKQYTIRNRHSKTTELTSRETSK